MNVRASGHPIGAKFLQRWSPRAFTQDVISEGDLFLAGLLVCKFAQAAEATGAEGLVLLGELLIRAGDKGAALYDRLLQRFTCVEDDARASGACGQAHKRFLSRRRIKPSNLRDRERHAADLRPAARQVGERSETARKLLCHRRGGLQSKVHDDHRDAVSRC